MKEKWLVSFGITHIVSLSFVLTFAVKNALLFNTYLTFKIFADISIGRIKYMNGINKVFTTSIVNSHTDRKTVFP